METLPGAPASADGEGLHLLTRDALAGVVGSIVLIANIVSFAALMFPGALAAGAPVAIWAMLVGSGVAGLWIAWRTTLPPLATGIDSPAGAVMVLLAGSAGSAVLAAGGTPAAAIAGALLALSAATVAIALPPLALGLMRWGAYLRFVPFPVVAGFLGGTGVLLILGGLRMAAAGTPGVLPGDWTPAQWARVAAAVAALGLLLGARRWIRSTLALPGVLLAMCIGGGLLLQALGLDGAGGGWYLPSLGALPAWHPGPALAAAPLTAAQLLALLPELLAISIVALISLVSKTSTLEVTRRTSSDLDRELRAHGIANLVVVPLGGLAAMMQLGSSRLLDSAGSATWRSGAVAAAVLLAVALAGFDLPALIPLPVAAGLVLSLGWNFLGEAFARPIAQRAWGQLLLAALIAFACVRWGYIVGVIGGVTGACVLFALGYARIGPVRRHLSRAQFAGNVVRAAETARLLESQGEAIQLYWLSGHLFFGSSESIFERVRDDLAAHPPGRVAQVVLDFAAVTGADASAGLSLQKLQNLCRTQRITLLHAALPPAIERALRRDGLVGGDAAPPPFADASAALAWCEEQLLARIGPGAEGVPFAQWLQQQLGPEAAAADLLPYLVQRRVESAMPLYRAGEPADAIDFIASGRLVVELPRDGAPPLRVRTLTTHAVVGEMGFARRAARSASVATEGPAELWTLSREAFERMRRERPALGNAFVDFLLRTLADRIELSDRMLLALGR